LKNARECLAGFCLNNKRTRAAFLSFGEAGRARTTSFCNSRLDFQWGLDLDNITFYLKTIPDTSDFI